MSVELPDRPRWVEAHAIAAEAGSWRRALGAGLAVGSDVHRLISIGGAADAEAVGALARAYPAHTLLIASEREDLAEALRAATRPVLRALLHTLAEPDALPDHEGAAPLPAEASLAHLPAELATELAAARARTAVWAAWVDALPVSFAYASARSPAWFTLAVDTAPGARQLGLATIIASTMIRAERAAGRAPVWGALEANQASLRTARRLGFEVVDALWVAPPAG